MRRARADKDLRKGARFLVHDAEKVRAFVQELKDRLGTAAAAKALAVTDRHLRRLANPDQWSRERPRKKQTIERRTVGGLQSRLGKRIWEAFVSPAAHQLIESHERWMREAAPVVWDKGQPHKDLMVALCRHSPRYAKLFKRFVEGMERHDYRRIGLALFRVLDPLIDSDRTNGIERGIEEMSSREIETFLRTGMRRELILLKREPDVQRAQGLAKR